MAHTPAPWKIDLGQLHGNGTRIGTIDDADMNAGLTDSEAAANAALIAAAPELLAALQQIAEEAGPATGSGFGTINRIASIASAAIAKAGGAA